jgi:hypothetical protein
MRISKSEHLQYLKKKVLQLKRKYIFELKEGRSPLQYLRDISFVIATLIREIRLLEKDTPVSYNSHFSPN